MNADVEFQALEEKIGKLELARVYIAAQTTVAQIDAEIALTKLELDRQSGLRSVEAYRAELKNNARYRA
jgi:hypothetical protein